MLCGHGVHVNFDIYIKGAFCHKGHLVTGHFVEGAFCHRPLVKGPFITEP